jgi:hypothetical protein
MIQRREMNEVSQKESAEEHDGISTRVEIVKQEKC